MKTTIAAIMLLISSGAFAHEIQQAGCVGGRLKYVCSDMSDGGKNYIKVHISSGVWGTGSADTIFNSPSNIDSPQK